jgi:hypothetical protein
MWIELVDERGCPRRALPDPNGGTFDAAGDFDRLLGPAPGFPVWSLIDECGDTWLDSAQAEQLSVEVGELLTRARNSREERGLRRLLALAAQASAEGLRLRCIGE